MTRKLADEDAAFVADDRRVDVLVARRVLRHRVRVHPALVRERALSHERLVVAEVHVREFVGVPRHFCEAAKAVRRQQFVTVLQREVCGGRNEVGVAAPLAEAVERALHLRGPRPHPRERVRHREFAVVMAMNPHLHLQRFAHDRNHFGDVLRHRPAVRVAQNDARRPARFGGLKRLQCVLGVRPVAVEKMLGIVEDFRPLRATKRDRVADHFPVFFERRIQNLRHLEIPRLADDRHDRRLPFEQCPQSAVGFGRDVLAARHSERDDLRMFQFQFAHGPEILGIFRVRQRVTALDVVDANVVEPLRQ